MWLKNRACHSHFNFEILLTQNTPILELETSPSGFKLGMSGRMKEGQNQVIQNYALNIRDMA